MSEQNQAIIEINNYPESNYNRLFPCTLTQLSPLHKVMVNVVQIDSNSDGDVYDQKSGKGVSLTKIACLKLMTAANVIMEESKPILPSACQRCVEVAKMTKAAPQCGGCPTKQDAAYQVSILVPEPSGGYRRYVATKEVNKTNYKGLLEHMAAQCETKALLRALRAGLGIKGSYTKAELQKPFAVALVVLNTTDPELKAALIQRYAGGVDALFGAPAVQQLPPGTKEVLSSGQVVDTETGEIISAGATVVCDDDEPPDADPDEDTPPWEQNEGPEDPFKNAIICQGCDQIIDAQGSWTPEMVRDYSLKTYGKILCVKCQNEEKKARSQQRRGA